ncbi:MAG: hypothetical protein H6551_02530 [Chitinophagales bacterium]|nr:hypothetical protein [Chitinophagaceae bacterium]MCB9063998.1 hypothetical protein [Chitinophagales bacterium]
MQKKYTRLPYIICYLTAFVLGMKQLREPDVWWQLLSGEWMLDNMAVTKTDEFSYTMEGARWINVKWLYEVVIAFLEKGLGPHGVLLLQALVNVAIVYLLLRLLTYFTKHLGEQVSTLFSTIAVLLLLALSEFRMAGRPEMVSHLLTVVYLFVLWRPNAFEWKRIAWLIPLQLLWANMHEGYPVGMVLIGAYIAGGLISYVVSKNKEYLQNVRKLTIVWGGMAVAILVNPNGIQLWKQPFEIYRQLGANKYTTELLSWTDPMYWTVQAKVHVAMIVAVMVFWVMKLVAARKQKETYTSHPLLIGYLLTIPLFGYLSLSANRNIPFAQIMLFPTVPVMLLEVVRRLKLLDKPFYMAAAKRTMIVSAAIGGLFYISVVSNKYYEFTKSPNKYGMHISMLHNPTGAAEFIKRHNLKGPAFSDYFVSSYLLWDLYPDFKSFIDLRDLDVFSADFFNEYIEVYNRPKKFYDFDSTYKFNYIVFSTSQLQPLQQLLYWKEGFNLVYIDPVSTIMLREGELNNALNHDRDVIKLFTWPQQPIDPGWAEAITKLLNPAVSYEEEEQKYAPMYAGRYYNMVKNYNISIKQLLPAVQMDLADNSEALSTLAFAYLEFSNYVQDVATRDRKLDSASIMFEKSVELDPENKSTHLGLATLDVMRTNFSGAKKHLEKYIEQDNTNDFVYYLYGLCLRYEWKLSQNGVTVEDVIDAFKRSVDLNESNGKAHMYLADAYWEHGDKDLASKHIRPALEPDIPWSTDESEMLERLKKLTGVKSYSSSKELIAPTEEQDSTTQEQDEHGHEGHNH